MQNENKTQANQKQKTWLEMLLEDSKETAGMTQEEIDIKNGLEYAAQEKEKWEARQQARQGEKSWLGKFVEKEKETAGMTQEEIDIKNGLEFAAQLKEKELAKPIEEKAARDFASRHTDDELIDAYLDPGYIMTDADKRVAYEVIDRFRDTSKQYNPIDAQQMANVLNPEKAKKIESLEIKMSPVVAAMSGAADGVLLYPLMSSIEKNIFKSNSLEKDRENMQTQNPVPFALGEMAGKVALTKGLGGVVSGAVSAAPVLSEAPALFQNAVSTGVALGLPDGVKTLLDEGDPVDALATGARSTLGGMAGSYLGGVAQGMGLDWLQANGLQNSALGEIGRQTLGGATFALGDSAVNYFLTPEAERPTADEIGQNIAMAALFSAVNGAVNTAKMTFENKQKLENAVQTVMQDYKTIQSGAQTPEEKITALYEVQEYNKELRTAIAQNRYIGQQEYIDKVLEGLDAVDNAVNVRLKQANMLPIENLAAGAATQANPNGLGADLIGAGTNNITSLPAGTENGLDLPLLQGYAGNTLPALLPQAGQPNDFLKELGLTPPQNANLIEFLRTGDTGKTANSLLTSRYLQAFNEGRTGEPLAEAAGQSGAQGAVLDAAGVRQDADVGAVLSGQRTGELAEGVGETDEFLEGFNGSGEEITEGAGNKAGIPKVKIDEILKTPKGSRPDPITYLSTEYTQNHLSKFNNRVTKIVAQAPTGTAGPPTGTFVMPSSIADDIIAQAGGNVSKLEQLLGLPQGSLGTNPVRIDIANPTGLRLPNGNELGTNSQWIPGGYTSGGLLEAIIDSPKIGQYIITPIK